MIDLNYKKHKLKQYKNSINIFLCEKCDNIIQCENTYSNSEVYNVTRYYYLRIGKGYDRFWPIFEYSCDEYIIKNIIE